MKTPHKHAALIKAWADGAEIQVAEGPKCVWQDTHNNQPGWCSSLHYRIKPETIRIGNVDVPKPLDSLEGREALYVVTLSSDVLVYIAYPHTHAAYCLRMVQRGLVHSSAENAIIHAMALIAISGGTV
jgi:hypothetical protein